MLSFDDYDLSPYMPVREQFRLYYAYSRGQVMLNGLTLEQVNHCGLIGQVTTRQAFYDEVRDKGWIGEDFDDDEAYRVALERHQKHTQETLQRFERDLHAEFPHLETAAREKAFETAYQLGIHGGLKLVYALFVDIVNLKS